jgi:pre-60S factor REI1
MQSDWHRYNLKRRVASLPPLSSEIFAEKVLANKASAAATAARASFEKGCDICAKTYFSENAYVNHLASSKHKQNVAKAARRGRKVDDDNKSVMSSTFSLGEPMEKLSVTDGIDEDVEEEFQEVVEHMKDAPLEDGEPISRRPTRPHASAQGDRPEHPLSPIATTTVDHSAKRDPLKECLFCTQVFDSVDASVEHMTKFHGMFIPEREYLSDLEGLVKYLNSKVNEDYECLFCGRLKWSEDGIKTHMRDTDHCKIAYDTEDQQLEIGQFYDFRSTYSDDEDWDSENEEMADAKAPGGGVKLGGKRRAKAVGENGEELPDADGEDGGWETDSTDISSVPTEELGRVYLDEQRDEVKERLKKNAHHSHGNTGRHRSADGFHSHAHPTPQAVYYDEYELHLPTGRTAGHRSLNKYYRQNLRNYPTPEEREQKLLTHGGSSDEEDESRPRGHDRGRQVATTRGEHALGMIGVSDQKKREVAAVEKRELKKSRRDQAKFDARVGLKGNSQKHWRDHLLQ